MYYIVDKTMDSYAFDFWTYQLLQIKPTFRIRAAGTVTVELYTDSDNKQNKQ